MRLEKRMFRALFLAVLALGKHTSFRASETENRALIEEIMDSTLDTRIDRGTLFGRLF